MSHRWLKFFSLTLAAAAGSAANAGIVGDAVHVKASTPDGRVAEWSISSAGAVWVNDTVSWSLSAPVDLRTRDGVLLGRLESLEVGYIADPVVNLAFNVTAGASTTTFEITSGKLDFAQITGAIGRASAAVTATELDGASSQFLTGKLATGRAFQAHINGPATGAGSDFAVLVQGGKMDAYSSYTATEAKPASGYVAAGDVSSMQTRFFFDVSPNDSASGTSVFVIIPAPAAGAVAGLGALLVARRRR